MRAHLPTYFLLFSFSGFFTVCYTLLLLIYCTFPCFPLQNAWDKIFFIFNSSFCGGGGGGGSSSRPSTPNHLFKNPAWLWHLGLSTTFPPSFPRDRCMYLILYWLVYKPSLKSSKFRNLLICLSQKPSPPPRKRRAKLYHSKFNKICFELKLV